MLQTPGWKVDLLVLYFYLSTCIFYLNLLKCSKHRQNYKDFTGNTIIFVLTWLGLSSHFCLEVQCMKSRGSTDCRAQKIALESRILISLSLAFE